MRSPKRAPEQPKASAILDAALKGSLSKSAIKLKPVKEPKRRRLPGEPDLTPLFPILGFAPASHCPHHGPLRRGTQLVCMICFRSGLDHLPALIRRAATDPKPESKPPPKDPKKLTRREIRALLREYRPKAATLAPEEREQLRRLGVVL